MGFATAVLWFAIIVELASSESSAIDSSLSIDDQWKSLEDEDFVSAVLHFIELSKSSEESGPCKSRTSLSHFKYNFSTSDYRQFEDRVDAAVKVANILNNLNFGVGEPEVSDPIEQHGFYSSVVRATLKTDPDVFAFGIVSYWRDRHFAPFAYRVDDDGKDVVIKDMTFVYNSSAIPEADWFWKQAKKNFTEILGRRYDDDGGGGFVPLANSSSEMLNTLPTDGVWSVPYYDCGGGDTWVVSYSAPFFAIQDSNVVLRGVTVVTVNLQNFDINQCSHGDSMFADTHKCDRESTMCIPVSGEGFSRGSYHCHCQPMYYFPDSSIQEDQRYFNGTTVEKAFVEWKLGKSHESHFSCLPCKPGCLKCTDDSLCYVQYDVLIRSLPLGIQSFCMTVTCVLAIIVFRLRKSKTISIAMWTTLEMILLGATLIYATVIIRYFEPTTMTCLMEPWFREIGFSIFYGAIVLKLYRILTEFKSRKAHRVLVRDRDLLKYQTGIVLIIIGYMAAWTAINMDNIRDGNVILSTGLTTNGALKYVVCKSLWWEYVTEAGEFAFLVLGMYMGYNVRNAVSDYSEKNCLTIAIYIEAVVSLLLYVIRHVVWLVLDPDYIFLMYFIRCQVTVTIILLLIFGPKLWYYHRPPTSEDHHRSYSTTDVHYSQEALKLRNRITSNGEVDVGEVNIAEMSPEDIKAELRRVYTQLQVLRNKTMRKDNPHISKRRGGRKVAHRRFSLQAFHHRHKHHHDEVSKVEDTEISKTPEESVCSVADIQPDGPSGRYEGIPDRDHTSDTRPSTHTVTFKSVRV